MTEWAGKIYPDHFDYCRLDLVQKFRKKYAYRWFRSNFEVIGRHEDPKTSAQLGFYNGLLLPEITEQLVKDGHTSTIEILGHTREIPVIKEEVHEHLTKICGYDGTNFRRVSDMDKPKMTEFINNVLDFAASLGMDMEKLKAWGEHS